MSRLREDECLRDFLRKREHDSGKKSRALSKLLSVEQDVEAYLANTLSLPFTSHNWSHVEQVERLCLRLVSKDLLSLLNDTEFLVLIMAIWLHDAGMVPKDSNETISVQ